MAAPMPRDPLPLGPDLDSCRTCCRTRETGIHTATWRWGRPQAGVDGEMSSTWWLPLGALFIPQLFPPPVSSMSLRRGGHARRHLRLGPLMGLVGASLWVSAELTAQ